jgi:indoleamine 2,3-dioxygenase
MSIQPQGFAPAPTALQPLATYDVDPEWGFIPTRDPVLRLPSEYDAWEWVVPEISALIRGGRLRAVLGGLPALDPLALTDSGERERAMTLLTTFANGWVWGDREPSSVIPANISVPLCDLARALDRPPIAHYASTTLYNWRRVEADQPLTPSNMRMMVQFLGGVDEDWFMMGGLGVEVAGRALPGVAHAAGIASHEGSDAELAGLLIRIAAEMEPALEALERVREWCDPHVFYYRVRPFLAGWSAPGVVYKGVSDTPQVFVGASAGQSALIQILDTLLGVDHGETPAGVYLRKIRAYMPARHRALVETMERSSLVRTRVSAGGEELREAYNAAIKQVDAFRRRHIGLAHDYIAKPSGMNEGELGTGGTNFVDFLRDARINTARTKL